MKPSSGQTFTSPRILCISLGSIGKRHLRNARSLLPKAHIAVWRQHTHSDVVPEGADEVVQNLQAALAFGPDAVLISSPASEHISNARPFAQRHVPIFVEKPLAASSEELRDFSALSASSQGFMMVGYVLRFLPALQTIKKHLQEGLLGLVHTARIEVGQYLPDWRPGGDYRENVSGQQKLGGGALLELSHEIDYATWLFGWPQSVMCSAAHLSALEIDVEDSAHVLMEYPDKRVSLQLDFLQRVATMSVQIVGSKGTLMADLVQEELRLIDPAHPNGRPLAAAKLPNGNDIYLRQFDFFFSKAIPGYAHVYEQTHDFCEWASISHSEKVLKLVDIAKQSSKSGARQQLSFKQEL
jgi:predicted dehydrogenase